MGVIQRREMRPHATALPMTQSSRPGQRHSRAPRLSHLHRAVSHHQRVADVDVGPALGCSGGGDGNSGAGRSAAGSRHPQRDGWAQQPGSSSRQACTRSNDSRGGEGRVWARASARVIGPRIGPRPPGWRAHPPTTARPAPLGPCRSGPPRRPSWPPAAPPGGPPPRRRAAGRRSAPRQTRPAPRCAPRR